MRIYEYRYVDAPRITVEQARVILEAAEEGLGETEVSLDLCRTTSRVRLGRGSAELGGIHVDLSALRALRPGVVYEAAASGLRPVEIRGPGGYYKLRPASGCGPPTIEINGIHMHRVEGVDPRRDAWMKTSAAGIRRGSRVLDICTGLGYTAIESLRRGASEVLSIEADERVLQIARRNPWSRELEDPRITVVLGDAVDVVGGLEEPFDNIIHDPPRFSSASGDLYGLAFYRELYRLLRCGGRLYHYTGSPGRIRGRDLARGVAERLRRVGFAVRPARRALGVVAYKPC